MELACLARRIHRILSSAPESKPCPTQKSRHAGLIDKRHFVAKAADLAFDVSKSDLLKPA